MRKGIITIWVFLLLSDIVHAQIQTNPPMRQVIGSSGDSKIITLPNLGAVTFDYTIGECMVTTISASSPFTVDRKSVV